MLKRTFSTIVLFLAVCTGIAFGQADAEPSGQFAIDPAHTSVVFTAEHLGLADIYGIFQGVSGSVTLGSEPAFTATIPVASVDTGVDKRDDHLRSPDFFDARQYPQITFQSTGIEREGDVYNVSGDLTMHGQTKEITLPLTYKGQAEFQGKQRVGFSGEITIDRREWGLDAWQGLVGNEIKMIISFEAVKQ